MNDFIAGVVRAAAETFEFPEPILEAGSYQVAGQEAIANLRPLFPRKRYVGIDMRPGPGVDSVENIEQLPRRTHSVGSVLALNIFEHVARFWRAFEEVQRILRPDGVFMFSCPFYFHIHEYPSDYWRFTPEACGVLLDRFRTKIIGCHGPVKRPLSVWAIAFGRDYPPITESHHQEFRNRIRSYARQPLEWDKQLQYRIGRIICGRGPFAQYFDAERFESQLHRAA
jgi:SAM-dependent methyltransferase